MALETNSYTLTSGTGASYINPELWVKQIMEFMKAKLVVTPLAKVYNDLLNRPGEDLNIQFNTEIAAAALTETTAITPATVLVTVPTAIENNNSPFPVFFIIHFPCCLTSFLLPLNQNVRFQA